LAALTILGHVTPPEFLAPPSISVLWTTVHW